MASKPRPDWKRYYFRRVQRNLWPYLLWSVLYLVFRVFVLRIGSDLAPATATVPLLGEVTGPVLLTDPSEWTRNLVWGKSYFHLYFMSVLLQFTLCFPLLFHGMRHLPLSFGHVLGGGLLLQGGVFYLQASLFAPRWGFTTPGSMAIWYLPALLTGAWIGLNWKVWPDVWGKWKPVLALGTVSGFALYFGLSLLQLFGKPISSMAFNAGATAYASGMALLLLRGSSRLAALPRWGRTLARIGDRSLPLFLLHPMILHLLSGPRVSGLLDRLPLSPAWAGLLLFAVTWGLIDLGQWARVNAFLFGRPFPLYAPDALRPKVTRKEGR
jgi:peptidoglycan/LPS O-acetylase OafA/YrhL